MGASSTLTSNDTPTANIIFGLVLFDLCLLFGLQHTLNVRRVVWCRVFWWFGSWAVLTWGCVSIGSCRVRRGFLDAFVSSVCK